MGMQLAATASFQNIVFSFRFFRPKFPNFDPKKKTQNGTSYSLSYCAVYSSIWSPVDYWTFTSTRTHIKWSVDLYCVATVTHFLVECCYAISKMLFTKYVACALHMRLARPHKRAHCSCLDWYDPREAEAEYANTPQRTNTATIACVCVRGTIWFGIQRSFCLEFNCERSRGGVCDTQNVQPKWRLIKMNVCPCMSPMNFY